MKPASIEKINGLGKAAHIIATILKVFTIIGIVGVIIGMIVSFALPEDLIQINFTGSASVEVDISTLGFQISEADRSAMEEAFADHSANGTLTINSMELAFQNIRTEGDRIILDAQGGGNIFSTASLRIILICALLALIATLVCMIFICKFSKSLKTCSTPFDPDLVRKMQQLAWAMLALPVINSMTQSIANSISSGNIQISLSIDLAEVILILAMFALSYIFKYGAHLQQQSDETL